MTIAPTAGEISGSQSNELTPPSNRNRLMGGSHGVTRRDNFSLYCLFEIQGENLDKHVRINEEETAISFQEAFSFPRQEPGLLIT